MSFFYGISMFCLACYFLHGTCLDVHSKTQYERSTLEGSENSSR